MLSLLIALYAQSEAIVRAPAECPWELEAPEVLVSNSEAFPRNGSFWVKTYGEVELAIETIHGSSVAADRIEIPFTSNGGRLVELRPSARLAPETPYQLRVGDMASIAVRTTPFADEIAPRAPQVQRSFPITSPFEICSTDGILTVLFTESEPLIFLFEDPADGSLYEAYTAFHQMAIPTEANQTIDFRVVAIDLAGNRSDATETFTRTAGDVRQEIGD